jgi:hypothetical protein
MTTETTDHPPHVAFVANLVHPKPRPARRNGKIARLPKPMRDLVNHMLDDGLPAKVIIDELGEAGQGLNAQNLTNWVQGGYQDYLKAQEDMDRAKAQLEAALDLLKEYPDADPRTVRRATDLVAATQIFETLREYGEEALKKMFQTKPDKYLPLLNTMCNMANHEIRAGKQRLALESRPPDSTLSPPAATPRRRGESQVGVVTTPSSPIKPNQGGPDKRP